ncbi:phosphoribosyltransferase [Candidatus Woesearchaeota archaeon]|jgi:uncharacterized protein|nr:phosphoribosyltransferase [Candidatus Woesearchaeota archaeon]MBT4321622.1 phosphoribosyltransferase [Candidatus Woesearchaeota archaeon]MBT4631067.1 phosphoribosyltransferase [Candidatus Woesearchaeota archaeon]
MDEKVNLTWEEIHESTKELASIINSKFKPDIVIAIGEGGWIPARLLKNYIKCPYYSIRCKNYDEEDNQLPEATITQDIEISKIKGEKVLILDEVADSGITMEKVHKHLLELNPEEIRTAVLHKKEKSIFNPDYIHKNMGNTWIVYPWDKK